jgi:hypothetical protein
MAVMVKSAIESLRTLRLKFEAIAASGDVAAVNEAMTKVSWDPGRRMRGTHPARRRAFHPAPIDSRWGFGLNGRRTEQHYATLI